MTRFAVGTRVLAAAIDPEGHTRLPRYVRGHYGEIVDDHGSWPLPDAVLRGAQHSERVYAVRFAARDLWGHGSHGVVVDLWESYLQEAPSRPDAPGLAAAAPGVEETS
ncbi:MAG: SH3-like domain-containing protein [Actinomycetota bacterium]